MTKLIFQIRWLMAMTRIRSWGEFIRLHAIRYAAQFSPFLRGFMAVYSPSKLARTRKRSHR